MREIAVATLAVHLNSDVILVTVFQPLEGVTATLVALIILMRQTAITLVAQSSSLVTKDSVYQLGIDVT